MDRQRTFFDTEFEADLEAKRLARVSNPSTSKQAAQEIVDEGLVGRLQRIVLSTLRYNPDSTAKEVSFYAGIADLHKRFRELERLGRIRVTGVRPCERTGRKAQTYRAIFVKEGFRATQTRRVSKCL